MTGLIVFVSLCFAGGLVIGLYAGDWWGRRRGWDECEEDQAWEREQARARRARPVFRESRLLGPPPEIAHETDLWPEIARAQADLAETWANLAENWDAHTEQTLILANPEPEPETDEEFSARLAAEADGIIAWVGEQAWLAAEHWGRPPSGTASP